MVSEAHPRVRELTLGATRLLATLTALPNVVGKSLPTPLGERRDLGADPVEMGLHALAGQLAIAALERFDDGAVLLVGRAPIAAARTVLQIEQPRAVDLDHVDERVEEAERAFPAHEIVQAKIRAEHLRIVPIRARLGRQR